MPNHYKTLEIDPKASKEVAAAAYKALAKKYSGDADETKLKRLNNSKEVVLDDTKRRKYDRENANSVDRGKVIGNYRIIKGVSDGGFGTTYKAEHRDTGMPVCIKHANNISAADEELLIEEAKAVWDLRHWGIPSMRDILRFEDDSVGLVMSYVPGPTLAQVLEHGPNNDGLDPENVAWLTQRWLNTLRYLHMHGVVMGDFKPQNTIIQPHDHTAVLVDYGLAKVKPKRSDGAAGYTPYFAAPEQLDGKPPIPQTDLFGLGMTMIFALGGDIQHIKVPGNTPENLCKFIKALIKRDPLSRPNVWTEDDLCDRIVAVREKDFGRTESGMKPLKLPSGDWD
jgi:serine/threonine protein kinase